MKWISLGFVLLLAGCQTPTALMADGNAAYHQHDLSRATTLYSKALAYPKTQGAAAYNLGRIAFEAGDFAGALPLFQQAVSADPQFARARFNLALCAKELGDHQQYEEQLRKAALLDRSLGIVWLELARLQASSGDLPTALQTVRVAFGDPATGPQARLLAASWKKEAGRPEEALADYQELVRTHPYLGSPYTETGLARLREGKDGQAEELLLRGLQLDFRQPRALLAIGEILERRGDRSTALQVYEKAIALPPDGAADEAGWRAEAEEKAAELRRTQDSGAPTKG